MLRRIVEHPQFGTAIMAVILFNAVILGLETSPAVAERFGAVLSWLDRVCLIIFCAEILAKLAVYREKFFRDGWNLFDLGVVGIAIVPATQALSVLRALRILRLLRVISVTPRLRKVIEAFVSALPGMASVFLLIGIIFYIGSVIATKLFGADFPQWFGSLGKSAYTLFQVMTLESWSMGIVRPVMAEIPWAWLFFVPFILLTTFTVMNLVVGLIVNSMQEAHEEEDVAATEAYREDIAARLERIERHLIERDRRR